ncbi:phage N-6-adenine-methyltransferase [Shewanella algae]|uniref:phage N-6-adenine-methyltransferase n=1 Tax=Shewanella algae TaxID=38313 RepID=UPI001AADDE8C|nr:phage N-6-adenine-methyltransferase [Shewanella algae]MBO2563766.1 phage N-6-adenine-methyltransferase [Shewanella algae]
MKKVVSFSGGRTSAYLCFLAVEQFGRENVDFIFCDTGAEHPATYEFIKQCDEYFGLNLVCLRGVFDTPLGTANHYKVGGTEIIGPDCEPFAGMMQKYGTPYAPSGGMCSRAMKEEIYTQYCNKKYGRGQYETWLGIRIDEPARLNTKERKKRVLCYLAEISDFDKQDILDWWQAMPFNLQLEEHLGNCVFCIKKSINKVALAARDEPEMLKQFLGCIAIANPREDLNRSFPKEIMYRGRNSLLSVVQKFADHSRDEIADTLRSMKKQESGSCTESCEGFSDEAETEAAPGLLNEAIYMNNYARRLEELKAQPCHKLKEVGDQWRTPPALFWGVFAMFGPFAWDLFSDGDNAKCPNCYTAEDNALTKDWAKDLNGRKGFANPPYSRSSYEDGQAITGMRNIIDKSILERDKGAKFAFLIKAATSEVWWPEGADHVCFIRGRISFDLPDWFIPADKKQEASSAGFACAIAVFDKDWHGEPFSYVNRDDLLRDGQVMLDMIDAAARKLISSSTDVTSKVVAHTKTQLQAAA